MEEIKKVFNQKFYVEEVTEDIGSIKRLGGEIEKTKVGYTLIFTDTKFAKCDFTKLTYTPDSNNAVVRLVFINCIFNDCNFSKSIYKEPIFESCEFSNCLLDDVVFVVGRFIKCKFTHSKINITLHEAMVKDRFTIAYCGDPVYISFIKSTWVECEISCIMSKCNITVNRSRIKGMYVMYSSLELDICNSSINKYFYINKSEVHIKNMKSITFADVEIRIHYSELYLAEDYIDDNSMIQLYKALKMNYTTITKIL